MLFTRLYNWIKYKTLPPSVLFLNRLFVERDSKHRRVTSNLGLTFRNSKWSTYARTNINVSSRTSYIYTLFKAALALSSLVVLFYFSTYFHTSPLNSVAYTTLWFLFDADVYLKLLFSSSLLCSFQLFASTLLNVAFNTLFGFTSVANVNTNTAGSQISIPKRLHKPIFYASLVNGTYSDDYSNLFNLGTASNQSKAHLNLFTNLYKSSHSISLVSSSADDLRYALHSLGTANSNMGTQLGLTSSQTSNFNLLTLDYDLFNRTSHSALNSTQETTQWVLGAIHTELTQNNAELRTIDGLFYLPNFSYSKLNKLSLLFPETSNFRNSVTDQLKVIQWNRWIYKYNILHRSLLKTASSITFTKRLLSSGFYNSSLLTNNIWAASAVNSEQLNPQSFGDITRSIYGDSYKLSRSTSPLLRPTPGFYNSNALNSLKFYEVSYHWFIQRFYQLNTLNTNHVQLSKSLNGDSGLNMRAGIQAYQASQLNLNAGISSAAVSSNSTPQTDIYLSYVDANQFSKSKLDAMQNLAANNSSGTTVFFTPRTLK